MSSVVSKVVEIDGIETHYLTGGEGPPLVLIHGGGSGADAWGNWRTCIPHYLDHFSVYAVDMIGFGKSAKPSGDAYDYGHTNRVRHMAKFIETVIGGPTNIIGNSMGGATALGVAIRRPELLQKLCLMGAAGLDISNPDPAAKKALGGYDYTPEGMRRLIGVLAGPRFTIEDDMVTYRHALTMQPGAKEAMGSLHAAMAKDGMTFPREEIASVEVETLVVGGKEDQIAVPARIYGYLELMPNSWGFVLPHCGHWVMLEAPEEFTQVTTAFFDKTSFRAVA